MSQALFPEQATLSKDDVEAVYRSLKEFNPHIPNERSEVMNRYLSEYGMNRSLHTSIGTFKSGFYTVCAYYFEPESPVDTVVIFHGYLDHAGVTARLQNFFIEKNYAVLMLDHPGLGFSTGERATVTNFEDYSDAAKLLLEFHEKFNLPGKVHVAGHSMGGAIILDLLRRFGKIWKGETLLFAPLVRSDRWAISKLGYRLVYRFLEVTPRNYQNTSHNKGFLRFLKDEVHSVNRFPISWAGALVDWNEKIENSHLPDIDMTVIQGTEEFTVDWRFNIRFFRTHFPNAKLHIVKGARHHLFNESDEYLKEIFPIVEDLFQ